MMHTDTVNIRQENQDVVLSFSDVFHQELNTLIRPNYDNQTKLPDDLIGLAFSGGGIRSATFNLGVLQALADANFLNKIDYLSTVSGGGYVGSFFTSMLKRAKGGLAEVQAKLRTNNKANGQEAVEIGFFATIQQLSHAKNWSFYRRSSRYFSVVYQYIVEPNRTNCKFSHPKCFGVSSK